MRRLLVIALMFGVMVSSGFVVPDNVPDLREDIHAPRVIPFDSKLPKYDNPTEIDLEDGNLHISFKGVFRGIDKQKDYVAFVFVITPKKDMMLNTGRSELFDGNGTRFADWHRVWIGYDNSNNREIIAEIPMRMVRWHKMPSNIAGELPTIARVNFIFNNSSLQYRNIKAEKWSVWEELANNLGMSSNLLEP
ncbi:MAG: hypothetical protein IJS28_05865 [Synergistaceae bacterium]|nr:hypothetical protein [Synergistaceae bacterium]